MHNEQTYIDKLEDRGIKPTAMRLLILRTMMQSHQALSLIDIVDRLVTAEKSTVSRTLALFLSHHLVHSIDDGSGALKYAVCSDACECEVNDLHVHFSCTRCHRTVCLEGFPVPMVQLPKGFSAESVNYVIKGICSDCSHR